MIRQVECACLEVAVAKHICWLMENIPFNVSGKKRKVSTLPESEYLPSVGIIRSLDAQKEQ